jgi:hypothetical protein
MKRYNTFKDWFLDHFSVLDCEYIKTEGIEIGWGHLKSARNCVKLYLCFQKEITHMLEIEMKMQSYPSVSSLLFDRYYTINDPYAEWTDELKVMSVWYASELIARDVCLYQGKRQA